MPPSDAATAPRWHRWVPWIAGAAAATIAARNVVGAYTDFGIYLDVAREFAAGGIDLYRERAASGPWAYPPCAALPFVVLSWLGDAGARWAWCLLLGLGTALLLRATARALPPGDRLRPWQWLVFGVLFQRCIAQNLTHGQLSLWVGTSIALGIAALQRRHDGRAGIWLGLAAALKLTPLLFVVALPLMGRARAAAAMLGTFLVAVLLLPWPFCGTAEHTRHLGDFARSTVQSLTAADASAILQTRAGPSIRGTLDHLLQARPIDRDGHLVNVVDLAPGTARAVTIAWSLAVAALLATFFVRARRLPDVERLAHQTAAVLFATVFFAPLVRVYHLAGAMLPFALFCRGPRSRRDWLWWATAAACLFAMTLRQRKLLGDTLWRAFDAGGLLHAALVAMAVWLLRDAAARAAASRPATR